MGETDDRVPGVIGTPDPNVRVYGDAWSYFDDRGCKTFAGHYLGGGERVALTDPHLDEVAELLTTVGEAVLGLKTADSRIEARLESGDARIILAEVGATRLAADQASEWLEVLRSRLAQEITKLKLSGTEPFWLALLTESSQDLDVLHGRVLEMGPFQKVIFGRGMHAVVYENVGKPLRARR